jgi:hypothetical protein
MQSQEGDSVAAFLQGAAASGISSEEVAALVETIFRRIDQALAPIVGPRGMVALVKRSLHLSRPLHPWLPAGDQGVDAKMDLAALSAALATRPAMDAAAAGTHLLQNFRALLTTLIGESLTERLLRPVWATFLGGASAPDMNS